MTEDLRRILAELLGTFVLVFIGSLAILSSGGSVVAIAFGFGLALLAGLYAFGEISGGHFNPAVSLGALLDGRIDFSTFVAYLVSQVAGGVLASLAILWASSQSAVASTATLPAAGNGTAFLVEVALTAVFVMVILKVTASEGFGSSAFVAIALTLAAIHLAAVPLTGASVNPARTLGPAIVGSTGDGLWIYLTAPFLGGALGWALHRLVTTGKVEPQVKGLVR
jgi:aquaporin Z